MINSAREKDFRAKQESDTNNSKISKTTSSSRQWAGFKNPRIVRVPRSFGGKDRHSKVTTIRGLRDRRIRLSVPTAIQLYDLQNRLGLSQPSKVVDWLIDATKHEIDKLPPLQMPPGNFGQFHQPVEDPQESNGPQSSLSPFFNYVKDGGIKINDHVTGNDQEMRGKCKEIERENVVENKWITRHEQENQGGNGGYMAAQNFFPVANQSFPGLLNNPIPYNPYYHWEPPNLSLSQFGTQSFPSQTDPQNSHSVLLPSSLALPSASQLFFCPPATTPSIFPPYMAAASAETDPRQQLNNHFQLLSSNSHHMLPNSLMPPLHLISQLNVHPRLHSQNNEDSQPNKGAGGS